MTFQSDNIATCGTYGIKSCTILVKSVFGPFGAPEHCNKQDDCFGDPHIRRWDQKRFDFHFECDLVLLHSDHVNGGVPLDLHICTMIQTKSFFSNIESASSKVSQTVFQLETDKFFVDDEEYDDSYLPMELKLFRWLVLRRSTLLF